MIADLRDRHRERKHFARAAFVRTTGVSVIPSTLQRLHGFGYNGIVRIHLSTWLVLKLEGSVHSVPRDVTLPSLDRMSVLSSGSWCQATIRLAGLYAHARNRSRLCLVPGLRCSLQLSPNLVVWFSVWTLGAALPIWFQKDKPPTQTTNPNHRRGS